MKLVERCILFAGQFCACDETPFERTGKNGLHAVTWHKSAV
jgi:hypothetical protein